MYKILVTLK